MHFQMMFMPEDWDAMDKATDAIEALFPHLRFNVEYHATDYRLLVKMTCLSFY